MDASKAQTSNSSSQESVAVVNETNRAEAKAFGWIDNSSHSRCDFSAYAPITMNYFDPHVVRKRVEATYPSDAAQRGIQGRVVIRALVNEKGVIEQACAVEGHKELDSAAERAALQWKLKPGYGLAFSRPKTKRNPQNFADLYIVFNFKLNHSAVGKEQGPFFPSTFSAALSPGQLAQNELRDEVFKAARLFPMDVATSRKQLRFFGEAAAPFIAEIIQSDHNLDLNKKAYLIGVLGNTDGERVDSALIRLLSDADPFVRGTTTSLIARRKLRAALPSLVALLKDKAIYQTVVQTDPARETDMLVRDMAIQALSAITGTILAPGSPADAQAKAWKAWGEKQQKSRQLVRLTSFKKERDHSGTSIKNHPVTSQNPLGANSSLKDGVVLVKSWKTGASRIAERVLNLSLRSDVPQYDIDIDDVSDSQKHYKLRLIASLEHTLRTPGLPCWSADFREVTRDKISGENRSGYHLLSVEGPGAGDYFPREEWAGHFCPIEKPNEVLDGHFYPIRAERRFLIENFLLSIKVTDYKYDPEKSRLKKLDLQIEFKNRENSEMLLPGTSAHAKIEPRPAKRN
jgi:TonB family protein